MSSVRNEVGLEIDEDIRHQQRVWIIERISWGVMALLMVAALAGLLGHGPLSSRTLDDPASGLLVHYERFERSNAQTRFRIQINPLVNSGPVARLSIGKGLLDKIAISRIEPEPAGVELGPDRITYVFTLSEPDKAAELIFHYKPLGFGLVQIEMGLEGNPLQTFTQFIYP